MAEDRMELISFRIGDQEFCIDVAAVREIRGWTPATPMPHAPDYMRGVINLRGAIMPVIDLKSRLGLGLTEPGPRHVIVVVQVGGRAAGLLVDAVSETFTVTAEQLQPAPSIGNEGGWAGVAALIPMENRLLTLLVADALLPGGLDRAA